jgi:hypothetical protein
MAKFLKLIKNQKGATAIEYGLIAALIAVAAICGAGGPRAPPLFFCPLMLRRMIVCGTAAALYRLASDEMDSGGRRFGNLPDRRSRRAASDPV